MELCLKIYQMLIKVKKNSLFNREMKDLRCVPPQHFVYRTFIMLTKRLVTKINWNDYWHQKMYPNHLLFFSVK